MDYIVDSFLLGNLLPALLYHLRPCSRPAKAALPAWMQVLRISQEHKS